MWVRFVSVLSGHIIKKQVVGGAGWKRKIQEREGGEGVRMSDYRKGGCSYRRGKIGEEDSAEIKPKNLFK